MENLPAIFANCQLSLSSPTDSFYGKEKRNSNERHQANRVFAFGQLLWCYTQLCKNAGRF
jgi:hypothetical protein